MMMSKTYLIDTNVLMALHLRDHSLHDLSLDTLAGIKVSEIITNQLIVQELATVLLIQGNDLEYTKMLIKNYFFGEKPIIAVSPMNQTLWNKSFEVFFGQTRGKLSFADCSLVAQARLEKIKTIITFDKDLKKEFKSEFNFL